MLVMYVISHLEVADAGAAEGRRQCRPLDEVGAHDDQVQSMRLGQLPRLLLREHLRRHAATMIEAVCIVQRRR